MKMHYKIINVMCYNKLQLDYYYYYYYNNYNYYNYYN